MKRYRVLRQDFDTRANVLRQEISPECDDSVKTQWKSNKEQIVAGLAAELGPIGLHRKVQDFIDIGAAPISLIAFHNRFFRQIRYAFTIGAYYPALTASCALGERILNHLILLLRDDFRNTREYKQVYRKGSFDNWDLAIDTLEKWCVLLPNVAVAYRELRDIRHKSLHFNPETDQNDRLLSLEAINKLTEIISGQFSGFGPQPWYIEGTFGAAFVGKASEQEPFVHRVVLPNCRLVGYLHLLQLGPAGWIVMDEHLYEDREVSDEEFRELYNNRKL